MSGGPILFAPAWMPADLRCTTLDGVAELTLARPHKRNAMDGALVDGLRRFFLDPPGDVRAVVLRGQGDHFCAGLDLSSIVEHDVSAGVHFSRRWHRAFAAIEDGDLPVVSVLQGAVIGGGLELAATTHIRVAEASAFYALPEGQRGIFVGGGGSVRIPRLIGVARMTDMMLTGRTYGAEEGAAIGLSQYVVAAGEGPAKAMELAIRIAGNAPMTNFAVMQVLPRIATADPATGLLTESLMSAVAAADPEAKRRLADFLEKRAAKISHQTAST